MRFPSAVHSKLWRHTALAALLPIDRSAGTRADEQRDASAKRAGGKRTAGSKKQKKKHARAEPPALSEADQREACEVRGGVGSRDIPRPKGHNQWPFVLCL